MKKAVKKTMLFLRRLGGLVVIVGAGLFALALGLYVTLIHPRDTRVAALAPLPPPHTPSAGSSVVKRVASLFDGSLAFSLSSTPEAYASQAAAFKALYPLYSTVASSHLSRRSPYQVFVTAGTYPERLEGRYGLLLPAGSSLTLAHLPASLARLSTAAFSYPGAARLHLSWSTASNVRAPTEGQGEAAGVQWPLPEPAAPLASNTWFYRNIYRFWQPDPQPLPGPAWQELQAQTPVPSTAAGLRLTCEAANPQTFCVVAEPEFWQDEPTPSLAATRRPNFVFVLVDTMRAQALHGPQAPFLTRLQERSHVWPNCMAAGNMTSPSTNALLACRKSQDLGPLGFSYGMSANDRELYYRGQPSSFPQALQAAGWKTAMIGNISVISEVLGSAIDHGFDEQIAIEKDAYDTPQITRSAQAWLRAYAQQNTSRPFFLYLHYHAPHAPYRPPFTDIAATYPGLQGFASFPSALRWLYQAEVHYTDRYLARVFQELQDLGLGEHTHFVLTADHGDHHETRRFVNNALGDAYEGTYFDHGATLYQDEIAVPLLMVSPQQEHAARHPAYASGLDLGPTILQLAGVPIPSYCQGRPLLTYNQAGSLEASTSASPRVIGSEGFRGKAILFAERYKYIRHYEPTVKKLFSPGSWLGSQATTMFSPEELYDLQTDPQEGHNLAFTNTSLLASARTHYRDYYGVKTSYQLVVYNPRGQQLEIDLPRHLAFSIDSDQAVERRELGERVVLTSTGPAPIIIQSPDWATAQLQVRVDGTPLSITKTSLRLPLTASAAELPIENAVARNHLPPFDKQALAYLQKVEDTSNFRHQIFANNPAFEQLLREWGYLNDN